jgi:hypothetical protein
MTCKELRATRAKMKMTIQCAALLAIAASAAAQTSSPAKDSDLIGLTTPKTLDASKFDFGLQFNAFRATDTLLRSGATLRYGIANNFEARLSGSFSPFDSVGLPSGNTIGYGGSDGNFVLKYKLPGSFDASIEAGVGYADTPAQEQRVATLLGASAGYSVFKGARVYVNPKFVALQDNSLFAVSVGAVVDVAPGISLFGDWTPLFDGTNAVSEIDGSGSRQQLYAVGIRFNSLVPHLSLDLGYTNMIGETYGFSLTPSLGNTGGLYVGLNYRL